jgi:membrane peptidoglycan carboxypeptidase
MKYKTNIDLKKRKKSLKNNSRFAKRNTRNYAVRSGTRKSPLSKIKKARRAKIQKAIAIVVGIAFFVGIVLFLFLLWALQDVTSQLPSPDDPFKGKDESSIIYASNERSETDPEVLYKVFGDENRDFIDIEEIPEHVKWAVLAAEDVDFYEHPGFDLGGLIKAGLYEVFGVGSPRGGSTITQQLIKLTSLGPERTYERKIKEIIFALQVERLYTKDEILEMYLNVSPYGSNVYGIKTAAKFYFGKEPKDLTLSEAAILVRIPQSPVYNSPTLAPDPELGKENALIGREYVLNQMETHLDKINDHIESDDDIVLLEEIEAAREEEPVYKEPRIDITAPHFVFYVQEMLTTGEYNNGSPFDLSEIQTGGYKIYTTLDTQVQGIAEEEVAAGVNTYSLPRGGHNGAAIVTDPKNGDILAMVGSKDYFAESEGKLFDGKVNVTETLQSMGSSMKPTTYYKAFEMGISSPGSYLPDVPIKIGDYEPKNWDNSFYGPVTGAVARYQLQKSRNVPAIILVDAMGVNNYIDTLIDFGYETIAANPEGYGHSLTLGGGDVTMVEHAQGFGIFANGGDLIPLDPIKKITKYNPETDEDEVIYEKEAERQHVADQRAIYMVNHILNYKNGGPSEYIDGRDFAGKTGTTEYHKDTVYAGYSPDYVIIGWNGNNDNTSLVAGSWGENVTRPWVISMSKRIAPYFPDKTPFNRPGGLISGNACSDGDSDDSSLSCAESGGDLLIEGRVPPAYIYKKTFRVCSDQQDHLARDIDETVGQAIDVEVTIYKMPSPSLQSYLDKAMESTIPTEYCTIERSPNGGNPWAIFDSPADGGSISGTLNFNVNGYSAEGYATKIELYLAGTFIGSSTTLPYSGSFDVSGYEPGRYPLRARVYDNVGLYGDSSINVWINGSPNPNVSISGPATTLVGAATTINGSYTGSYSVSAMNLSIRTQGGALAANLDISSGSAIWTPDAAGTYTLHINVVTPEGIIFQSNDISITVN